MRKNDLESRGKKARVEIAFGPFGDRVASRERMSLRTERGEKGLSSHLLERRISGAPLQEKKPGTHQFQ